MPMSDHFPMGLYHLEENKNCLCPWTHDLQDATKVSETYRRGICWVSADLPNSMVPFKNGEENK